MRMIDLLIAHDRRTQGDIAIEAGMKPKELSDKLKGKHKKLTLEDVRAVAKVLRVASEVLLRPVSKRKILELAKDREKSSQESTPSEVPARHLHALPDYTLAEDAGLIPVRSIDEADGMFSLPLWNESIAATDLQANHGSPDQRHVWAPKSLSKKLRAVEIHGDSMNKAGIEPGDVLFVRLLSDPAKAQNEICVISDPDGATLKRVKGRKGIPESTSYHPEVSIPDGARFAVAVAIHKRRRK